MVGKRIEAIFTGLILATSLGLAATQPTTTPAPSSQPTTQPDLAAMVTRLGSADPDERESATARLWALGDLALPALAIGEQSPNPELSIRSHLLKSRISDGIFPDTPPDVTPLLNTFRASAPADQVDVLNQLFNGGVPGMRVLLALRKQPNDPATTVALDGEFARAPRLAAGLLLAAGDRDPAEAMLDALARKGGSFGNNDNAAKDDAVYWLLTGGLHAKRVALEHHMDGPSMQLLCFLRWCDGAKAVAIQGAGPPAERDQLMINSGRFSALARELRSIKPKLTIIGIRERAVVERLAGMDSDADGQIQEMLTTPYGPQGPPPSIWDRAQALCLNDRPELAIKALIDGNDFAHAAELMSDRLDFEQISGLADRHPADPNQRVQLLTQVALADYELGETDTATRWLEQAAKDSDAIAYDARSAVMLCRTAVRMRDAAAAHRYLLSALTRGPAATSTLFAAAGVKDPVAAVAWWSFFRSQSEPEPAMDSTLAIAAHQMPGDKFLALAQDLENSNQPDPAFRAIVVSALCRTLSSYGHSDEALAVRHRQSEQTPSIGGWCELGDAEADRHNWPGTIDAYARAVRIDPSNPSATFLLGWARCMAGDPGGAAQMRQADLLALGDDSLRVALFDTARRLGLTEVANRERKLLDNIEETSGSEIALAKYFAAVAEDAETRKDYPTAAHYRLLEWIDDLGQPNNDLTDEGNLVLPARLHCLRALDLFSNHKPDEAMAEAAILQTDLPGDMDRLIQLVRVADASGATRQADALYAKCADRLGEIIQRHPDSAALHTQLARIESRCRRNLDDALANANRAVELAPRNTASLDTLAETHYQRREFQNAIDTIQKCIKSEPDEPRYRSQLARFQLGFKTGVVGDD